MICGRYGEEEGGWRSCEVRGAYGVEEYGKLLEWIGMWWVALLVGSGRRVRFWLGKWCSDESLKDVFPSLFTHIICKEAWVKDV